MGSASSRLPTARPALLLLAALHCGCPNNSPESPGQAAQSARASASVGRAGASPGAHSGAAPKGAPKPELPLGDAGPAGTGDPIQIRFETHSQYSHIFVVDQAGLRHLRFGSTDAVNQTTISLADPDEVPTEYVRLTALSLLLRPSPGRGLLIGLGGGSVSRLWQQLEPSLQIVAVEIDPAVVEAAQRFFGLRPGANMEVVVEDGGRFVANRTDRYGLVLADAYLGGTIPEQLRQQSFFDDLGRVTANDGVAMVNLSVPAELERTLERRFRSVFPAIRCARTRNNGLLLFGSKRAFPSSEELMRRAEQRLEQRPPSFDLVATAEQLSEGCPRLY